MDVKDLIRFGEVQGLHLELRLLWECGWPWVAKFSQIKYTLETCMPEDSGCFLLIIWLYTFLVRVSSYETGSFIDVIKGGCGFISISMSWRLNQWCFFVSWLRKSLNQQILIVGVNNLLYFWRLEGLVLKGKLVNISWETKFFHHILNMWYWENLVGCWSLGWVYI